MKEPEKETNKHIQRYKLELMPKCFLPCPPFYDICNRADFTSRKCNLCYEIFDLVDYIE